MLPTYLPTQKKNYIYVCNNKLNSSNTVGKIRQQVIYKDYLTTAKTASQSLVLQMCWQNPLYLIP